MRSPFPGMDPFLEYHWGDVHHRLVTYASDALQKILPADLRCRVEERIFIAPGEDEPRTVVPDVRIVEHAGRGGVAVAERAAVGVVTAEPLIVRRDEPESQGYIEVREKAPGRRLVTVIEFISPSNKRRGQGEKQFLQKRREVHGSEASTVDIDLTLKGHRGRIFPMPEIPKSHRATYLACVWRGWQLDQFEIYAMPLRQPLPTIRIPLRRTDADAPLNLQALVDLCYENGRYDDIDYDDRDMMPRLSRGDEAWAEELLKARPPR